MPSAGPQAPAVTRKPRKPERPGGGRGAPLEVVPDRGHRRHADPGRWDLLLPTRPPRSRTRTRPSRPRPRTSTTRRQDARSGSSPTRTASHLLAEMPPDDAERRDRRRGPHLLHQQRHRPEGHPPGGVLQRSGQLHPGRVHDHPAVRQDPLPDPGAHPLPQGQGGVPLAQGAEGEVEVGDPRGLPQHHLLRPRRVRRPGRLRGLLRQAGQGPDRAQSRRCWPPCCNSPQFDPSTASAANGRRCSTATTTCSAAWSRWATSTRPRPTRYYEAPAARAQAEEPSQYGGQRGFMLTMVEELHRARLRRRRDRHRRAARRDHVHPQGDERGRGRRAGAAPDLGQKPARRRRERRRPDRRAARLLRRPELPRQPAQLGAAGGARLVVQAVRPRGRAQGRVQPQGHLRRQLALPLPPRAVEVVNEGAGTGTNYGTARQPAQGDRGVGQHRLRRPDRLDPQRAREDPVHGQQDGRSRRPSRTPSRASRARHPGLEPNRAIALGSATDQPDQHGQRLRDHRQRRRSTTTGSSSRR